MFHWNGRGDRPALLTEKDVWSYERLTEEADGIAAYVGRRCLVFLLAENVPEAIAGYVGFLSHGVVPVMVDAALDA